MKKRATVTQKQIAKEAGVSQTVVSLALSGSYDITLSEDTRQRVLEVADALGYVPQAAAKSLVKGRSNNIGLVLVRPHYQVFRDPYIPNVITGLSSVVRSHNCRLVVEHIDDIKEVKTISNMLKGGEVAGIVLSSFDMGDSIIEPLVQEGYPIVMLDTSPENYHVTTIDHVSGVESAAKHFIDLGHRDVGCIAFGPVNTHLNKRLQAFIDTFAKHDIEIDPDAIRFGHYDPESGYQAMQSLLADKPHLTAIFGMNDMMAIGAMRAIIDAGLRVPEDIALIGYDDMRFAEFTNPALTTVSAPEVELGQAAGEMLIQLIRGKPVPQKQISMRTKLIIRASCGAKLGN